ncbi:dihydrodipicolinate synthase family protein [Paenibacillus montaniterrae]|uniref:Dihydrodipicolinate synthase family protein n=1 Tax=Paenibacillus montaniterrae TaxID=429341 RepID=A0A919YSN3_9BACL|nr:dihydrodipicolinate synthase family protein [Paenibacillus montaniterrae]GIP17671.1 dihydrodipicolinate synthase family protein [Paenibacillus montaniterrae]
MKAAQLKAQLKGIYVLAITPFTADGSAIDEAALARNIDHYIAAGAHGIVVGGTYAEYPSMTAEERKALFRYAAQAVAGRVPLLCCTAASGTAEAIMLTEAAKEYGASGVMVTPPYVSEVRPTDIAYHFQLLNDAVDFPIFIYNSASIGVHLTPEEIKGLAELSNVAGVKQGATDLHALVRTQAYAGDKIAVMCGSDGLALGAIASGLAGCTSTNANFMASEFVALYEDIKAGRQEEAIERYYSWQPIRELAKKYGQPAMVKAALDIVGLPSGPVRAPFRSLDDAAREEIRQVLKQVGIIS